MNDGTCDLNLSPKLAGAALTVLVRTCRKDLAEAGSDDLESACAATRPVLDRLLDDACAAPWVAEAAFQAAALEIAQAGIGVLRSRSVADAQIL